MTKRYLWVLAIAGSMALAVPALAQVEQGAKDIYHGAKTNMEDALLSDKETKEYTIHVDTHGNGVVELSGNVPSAAVASHAARLARNESGVTLVRNDLTVGTALAH